MLPTVVDLSACNRFVFDVLSDLVEGLRHVVPCRGRRLEELHPELVCEGAPFVDRNLPVALQIYLSGDQNFLNVRISVLLDLADPVPRIFEGLHIR